MRRTLAALLAVGLCLGVAGAPVGALSSNGFADGAPRGTSTPYGHMGAACFDAYFTSGASSQLVGLYVMSTSDCGENVVYFTAPDGERLTVLVHAGADIVLQRSDLVALGYGQFQYASGGAGGAMSADPCTAWYWPAQLTITGDTVTATTCP